MATGNTWLKFTKQAGTGALKILFQVKLMFLPQFTVFI
jgi:hypothetical protein